MKNIAVFASGSGTNAEKIFEKFQNHPQVRVRLLLSNNPKAGVIARAANFDIQVCVFDKSILFHTDDIVTTLKEAEIDLIVLAGFLLKVPENLLRAYPNRIVNIHPALLPKYGGKGMYGRHVHEAVVAAKEKQSGISIHLCNEHFDEGKMIFQASCELSSDDSPEDVAAKVQKLEHQHYPEVVEELVLQLK
ncbi:phosphoribosylglycinamide formyltransferase [Catalinimonas niigatensis]|uniref:phosphoribosylglycinamide formyltransferase n=1 Tax=Catalinimonas niigatensis TaxID=1397264 RepID=UPI002666E219|nr:phosphoribosylglycinamide formyltransferase [Catalinimonas niigatensis]WPP53297.1 phosphoribosylglycinamide formyltransferase [Catalinimonas niigatensis]